MHELYRINNFGLVMIDPTTHMWFKPNLNDDEKGILCPKCYSRLYGRGRRCFNCEDKEKQLRERNERIDNEIRIRQWAEFELAKAKQKMRLEEELIKTRNITCSISRTPTVSQSVSLTGYKEKILGPDRPDQWKFPDPTSPSIMTQLIMNCKTADIIAIFELLERNYIILHGYHAPNIVEAFRYIVKYTPEYRLSALKHITDKYLVVKPTYSEDALVDEITDAPVPTKGIIDKFIDLLKYIFFV